MKAYIKRYYKLFLVGVVFVALETMCDLLQPSIMSNIVDKGIAQNDMDYILREGRRIFLVTFMGFIFAIIRNIVSTKVSQDFAYDIRNDLFIKINNIPFKTIEKFNKSSLITRVTNDISQLQYFVGGTMRVFVKAPVLCIGSLIMAIRLNLRLSVILIFIIITIFIIIPVNIKIGYPLFQKVQKCIDGLNSKTREYLGGVRVIKIFNKYEYESEKFDKVNEELSNNMTTSMRIMSVFTPLITFIMNMGIIIVLYIGNIEKYDIKPGVMMAYINYMARILSSLIMMSHIFNIFVRSKASYERVSEILYKDDEKTYDLEKIENIKSIRLENINFSYNKLESKNILDNINLEISKEKSIGIIGATGSGKTSIVNLILKLYEAEEGKVKINNLDIKDIDSKSIRECISVVPQNNTLFTGSIIENIKVGNENATLDEIKYYCEISKAHEFITSFTNGYETLLGQGGVNLSGGQKQRISIARALIRRPNILILDDATSALDLSTEFSIKNNLKNHMPHLNYIIIAQRISSVIDCEKIYVIEDGNIVGEGKHEGLIRSCKVYQNIFKSQVGR